MKSLPFKPVSSQVDFPKMEQDILGWWYSSGLVEKYLHKNDKSKKKFRFLDGPITANNPMGVQHGQGRTLKDLFQRYKNARGYKQRFQNGFDCQGLWLEVQEERDLGLNSKREIENFGIEKFCLRCRARVDKYAEVQTEQSKRLGMFMDWGNSYYTMSEQNNLYIWHFLKKCNEKGWLYKGIDSMPWCPRCGTAISHHELSDDGYKVVEHTSVYVKFPIEDKKDTYLLIWTTTPWTLAANVSVAVNPTKNYVKVKSIRTDDKLILAKNRLSVLSEEYKVEDEFLGEELVRTQYKGPFDEISAQKNVKHEVIPWDEVSEEEGSGLVHIAPGAGEEDFSLGKKFGLAILAPLDEFGIYLDGYDFLTGKFALDVKEEVFDSLKKKGFFYKTEPITHSYPHCWRCKHELVFRATSEWFIKADEIRPLMKKAATGANWLPDSALKRMEDWLTNMGDWPISRRRYWGLALPFYECPCGELTVIGSKKELRERSVSPEKVDKLPELHRPWVDDIEIVCPKCGEPAYRVKEVGDCWLDAGIVSFSTINYLSDKKYWREWFPFDFITEYMGQIKLWFYSTLFMSVALENAVPWKNVLATGYIVDEKGEPMHKTKGNFIHFDEAAEKMGVDVMRWVYLSNNPYENIKFGYNLGDGVRRRFLLIFWNAYSFFVTYANIDQWKPGLDKDSRSSKNALDQWILARLDEITGDVTAELDKYDPYNPTQQIETFVQDLSTWYVRRSRSRVGPTATDQNDKRAFFETCYFVLVTLSKLLAPFMPFVSEEIYKNLTGKESVHLEDWPKPRKIGTKDKKIIEEMSLARQLVEQGHALRKSEAIRVRQPLPIMRIETHTLISNPTIQLIKDELNVKVAEQVRVADTVKVTLDTNITPTLIAEGKARELVREIQDNRKELGTGLGERVIVYAPGWPKEFEDYIKKETLAVDLRKGEKLHVERAN